jgi:hypothetical protein
MVAAWRHADGTILLTTHTPTDTQFVRVHGLDAPIAAAQALPDGDFMVVSHVERNVRFPATSGNGWSSRAVNAWVFDNQGALTTQGDVGRYVNQLQVSTAGTIWVGYSDQGVYEPGNGLSTHGLVQFSSDLTPEWTFPQGREVVIDDCGSLNLADESVWTCPYAEYPLVRIEGDDLSVWHWSGLGDGDNFAAVLVSAPSKPEYVALVAEGWSHHPGLVAVGRLNSDNVETIAKRELRLPDGSTLPKHSKIVSRGPDLHVVVGLDWYQIGLEDFIQ